MKPMTRSSEFPKLVPVEVKRSDTFDELNIKNNCFLLTVLYSGSLTFRVGETTFEATAPCFVCFDERISPVLLQARAAVCDSVYFEPTFLNVNMTYVRIHSDAYARLADRHDMFLLSPFTDSRAYVFPFFDESADRVKQLVCGVEHDLRTQSDWYWSCRSRSYFMELLFILERAYACNGRTELMPLHREMDEGCLQKAILYIEDNYPQSMTLSDIADHASVNHTTLTRLFKGALHVTPVEYLWRHRLRVAKKQLEFTNLPMKDIVARCGFKTVQHFCRKFEQETGMTPTYYRKDRFEKRLMSFQKGDTDMATAYTDRRKELEDEWQRLLQTYGEGSEELIAFTQEALNEYPDDVTMLYRRVCDAFSRAESLERSGFTAESRGWYARCYEHGTALMQQYPDFPHVAAFVEKASQRLEYRDKGDLT